MRIFNTLTAVTFAFVFLGCQKAEQGSDAQYSLLNSSDSSFSRQNLWNNLNSTPKLKVCLAMIGYDLEEVEAESTKVKKLVEFGVLGWLKLLKGRQSWRNETLALDFKVQTSFCENADKAPFNPDQVVLKLHWYKNDALFQKMACVNWNKAQGACRSHATQRNLRINVFIDRKIWASEVDKIYVAHEFGHMLGLGDTYSIPQYLEPVNQPPSVMNMGSNDFTEDDKLAVGAAFEIAMGRSRGCGQGASESGTKANVPQNIFCLPDAKAVINHGPDRNDKVTR